MAKKSAVSDDVVDFTKDWRRLQQQKWRSRGGVEARMLLSLGMYFGEHGIVQTREAVQTRTIGKDEDMNRLNLVFNMLKKAARRKMGHIWRLRPECGASPNRKDPRAYDQADVVNDLNRALDFRCKEGIQHWRRVWWLVLTGVVISHTPWVEESVLEPIPEFDPESGELLWRDNQGGQVIPQSVVERVVSMGTVPPERFTPVEHLQLVGDVSDEVISGLNFFIDAGTPTIAQIPPDQACYILNVKTVDWIKDNFGSDAAKAVTSRPGDDLSIIKTKLLDRGPTLASMNLRDLVPAIQGSRGHDDPPMAIVATRYQPACEQYPHGRRSIFVPDQEMLDDDDCPYNEIPCVDIHLDAPTNSFWSADFLTDLIPAQKFLNKRWSQIGEAANSTIHETLLLGGELGREDIPTDMPGVIEDGLDEEGHARVQSLQRAELPGWTIQATQEIAQFITSVGGSDLTQQSQFPGQLRGPLALPIIQELMDSEDAPFYEHLGTQVALIKQMRVNRVRQFYPPIRTLHFTDSKDEVLVFHTDEILRSGTDFTIMVDPSTLMPELSAMRRARIIEDLTGPLAILYTDPRTGKLDASKIAMAVKYQDRNIEDAQVKNRRLAQHIIARIWKGELLSQTNPDIPYAFWDHNVFMDEYLNTMTTTEWLESSPIVKTEFTTQYEKHRDFLAAIQQSQMDSVQSNMMNGAMAMATQQAAVKAASVASDAAIAEIKQSGAMSVVGGVQPGQPGQAPMGLTAPPMASRPGQMPQRPLGPPRVPGPVRRPVGPTALVQH